jgi:hypothetical protein
MRESSDLPGFQTLPARAPALAGGASALSRPVRLAASTLSTPAGVVSRAGSAAQSTAGARAELTGSAAAPRQTLATPLQVEAPLALPDPEAPPGRRSSGARFA